jgi:hypothetical protein
MHIGIGTAVLVVWLVIGAIAAGQRGYFGDSNPNCSKVGRSLLTVVAGPLNYAGVNPKTNCKAPQPSK